MRALSLEPTLTLARDLSADLAAGDLMGLVKSALLLNDLGRDATHLRLQQGADPVESLLVSRTNVHREEGGTAILSSREPVPTTGDDQAHVVLKLGF